MKHDLLIMKVLQVINALKIGGAEKLLVDLVLVCKAKGVQLDVLLLNGENSFLLERLKKEGVTVISLGEKTNIYNPLSILALAKYMKNYDIIHAHLFPTQYWVVFASLFIRKKKILITTEHSTHNRRRDIRYMKPLDSFVYKRYASIIAISEQTQTALKRYLPSLQYIKLIENGIDVSLYNPDELAQPKRETDKFILIQVAGFRAEKDQKTVVRALKSLPENVHLWLVGEGDLKAEVRQLVVDLSLSARVEFLGIRKDIPALLNQADVVVMSSFWEGFGLAALEGMAAEKPVVASDVPGLREVVEGAGLLFELEDEEALAQVVLNLRQDNRLYDRVANACKERAKEYDISIMAEKYLKLYRDLQKCGG